MSDTLDLTRRSFLRSGLAGVAAGALAGAGRAAEKDKPAPRGKPTQFQVACMTLPYSRFPLERALTGIKSAGYRYVAWGISHKEEGEAKPVPMMPADAPPEKAKELGKRC